MGIGDLLYLVGRYGNLAVFFGVMLESAGGPLPGETVLIASGALAHEGILDLEDPLLFGILGAVTGAVCHAFCGDHDPLRTLC